MSDLSDAHLAADEALRLKAENERLRGMLHDALIKADAERLREMLREAIRIRRSDPALDSDCPICEPLVSSREYPKSHFEGCPWPAILAEAEKP
jgi:hypothetical protein